jgi:hypothetical protein
LSREIHVLAKKARSRALQWIMWKIQVKRFVRCSLYCDDFRARHILSGVTSRS